MATSAASTAKKTAEVVADIVPVNVDVTNSTVGIQISRPFIIGVVGGVAATVITIEVGGRVLHAIRVRRAVAAYKNQVNPE